MGLIALTVAGVTHSLAVFYGLIPREYGLVWRVTLMCEADEGSFG